MGLVGHQTIYGMHYDPDNYHLHIAVNRMKPETGKVVLPFNGLDIQEAHEFMAYIEYSQGGQQRKSQICAILEDGELARRRTAREIKPKQAALDLNTPPVKNPRSASRRNAATAS